MMPYRKKQLFNQPNESVINLTGEVAKGGSIAFLGSIIGRLIRFGLQVFLGHVLGVALYGVYTLGISIAGIVQSVASLGIQNGTVRFGAMYLGKGNKPGVKGIINIALRISIVSSTIAALVLFFLSRYIGTRVFNEVRMISVLQIFSISIPFCVIVEVLASFAQSARKIKYQVCVQNIFRPIVNLILVALAFILGSRLIGVVYGYLIATILSVGLGYYFLLKIFPAFKSTIKPVYNTEQFLRYSLATFMMGISYVLLNCADRIMLGYFGRANDVGIYNAAAVIAMQIMVFLGAFVPIFSPMVSDLCSRGRYYELASLFRSVTRWTFSLTLPLFVLVVVFSKNALSIFGDEFIIGWQVLVVLGLSQLVNATTGPVGVILQMSGRQNIELLNGMFLLLLNISLNIWLIPLYGVFGAAVATAAAITLINIVKLVEVVWIFKMLPYDRHYLKPVVAAFLMVILLHIFCGNKLYAQLTWTWIFVASFLSSLAYASVIYLAGLSQEDKAILSAIKMKLFLLK